MKKALIGLLILLLSAWVQSAYSATTVSGRPSPGKQATASLLFSESFDGLSDCDGGGAGTATNCNNTGWTWVAGTLDYAATGLIGTYGLSYNGTNGQSYHAVTGHTGTTKIYAAEAVMAVTGNSQSARAITLTDSDGVIIAYSTLTWSTDHYDVRLYYNAGANNATCTLDIDDDELWYIKIEYTPGSGANGVVSIFGVQDSSGFPGWGSACQSITNSTDTANVGRVYPGRAGSSSQYITFDEIKVDVNDITYP